MYANYNIFNFEAVLIKNNVFLSIISKSGQIQLFKYLYICLFHTHMVYCYIMTNIIMNTHTINNNIYNIIIEVIS